MERLKDENAALRQKLAQVEAENASLTRALDRARGENDEPARSWLGRLVQRLSGGN